MDERLEPKPLEKQGGRITLKTYFRNLYGFRNGLYCKNCKYFKIQKGHYKCEKMSTSHCKDSDIRKNDIACDLYCRK